MRYKRLKGILKAFLFLVILFCLMQAAGNVLKKPKDDSWDASGLTYVHENQDSYDVIFAGTSMVIVNISMQELYSKYGIAGVTLGEPEQPVYLSYYDVKEALKWQVPQAVLFDVNGLFYTQESVAEKAKGNEHHYVHYSMQELTGLTKYQAFLELRTYLPEADFWNYFSEFYYSHGNWESLSEKNFDRTSAERIMNGNLMLTGIQEGYAQTRAEGLQADAESTSETVEIPECNMEYLIKLIELCENEGTQLILLKSSGKYENASQQYQMISQIAEDYGIPYLDINRYDMVFDWAVDSADGWHHNILGAQKWTDIIGEYLICNYTFSEDRRNNENYSQFSEQEEKYQGFLSGMQEKAELLYSLDLNSYLSSLDAMDQGDNLVFLICQGVQDETELTDDTKACLAQIGIDTNRLISDGVGYAAVLDDGTLTEVGELLEVTENDEFCYQIIPENSDTSQSASLLINETEILDGGQGFHIVVYNRCMKEVISNVYFNLSEENPVPLRQSTGQYTVEQYEADVNVWANR